MLQLITTVLVASFVLAAVIAQVALRQAQLKLKPVKVRHKAR
jgi:hypothetical protein